MLTGVTRYRVQGSARRPLIDFMISGLESAGCRILSRPAEGQAPFVITFETTTGERMGIVAYAFLATRTPTKNRPADERSFQIKYGNKADNSLHALWTDRLGLYTTLFLGIDPDDGFFVAADPAAHNPTKFFIRLEFKDRHAEAIQFKGWHAWERERRSEKYDQPIEVLVGGTRRHFLDLVYFERAAAGLSPGDRQLLAEKPELGAAPPPVEGFRVEDPLPKALHPLVKELNLSADQILEVIAGARRLKMAVRGWVAEKHLQSALETIPGVVCSHPDAEGGPDIELHYKKRSLLRIECKNVLRETDSQKRPRIDFQRTRASKTDPCSRYYSLNDFEIVAGCLHALTEQWEFRYALTADLPAHARCAGKISNNLRIDNGWTTDPVAIFERAYARIG